MCVEDTGLSYVSHSESPLPDASCIVCIVCVVSLDISGAQLDGQITHVVADMQKAESKLAQLKETFERQKVDIRSLERDRLANSRTQPKVHIRTTSRVMEMQFIGTCICMFIRKSCCIVVVVVF